MDHRVTGGVVLNLKTFSSMNKLKKASLNAAAPASPAGSAGLPKRPSGSSRALGGRAGSQLRPPHAGRAGWSLSPCYASQG